MKPSHITTPRSLSECNFTHGYTSGPSKDTGYSAAWWIAVSICSVVAAVVIALTNGAPQ